MTAASDVTQNAHIVDAVGDAHKNIETQVHVVDRNDYVFDIIVQKPRTLSDSLISSTAKCNAFRSDKKESARRLHSSTTGVVAMKD